MTESRIGKEGRSGPQLNPKTREVLEACRDLRWRYTQGRLAEAVDRWQREGCPDIPAQGWQSAGVVAIEVLDQLKERAEKKDESTSQGRLANVFLEIAVDAEDSMPSHVVADALIQALASFVLHRMSGTGRRDLQPRVALETLKAHFVRLGAQIVGGRS